jgi:hypothetical protein
MVVKKLAGGVYSAALAASGAPGGPGTAPGVLNDTFDFGPVAFLFVALGGGIIACTMGFLVIKYSLSYAFQEIYNKLGYVNRTSNPLVLN